MGEAMKNEYGTQLDRNGYAPTIMQPACRCYMCAKGTTLQRHEIYGNAYRDKSKRYGLWVWLCMECHHNIHFVNAEQKVLLREQGQTQAMKRYGWSKPEFIERFGKNYL